ncbi:hypothetical protein SAMN06295973_0895 [Plantibacter cousiniae]|uniref:PEP-CTERM protein-sorting domain-containing protein n=2 Tax=Plantibacter cousiniae (nom. nud.) TaxID=199709 RepID=A0ABY1LID4_9MICO|nr:hypothetical protein SAMN06295973_0895 [Plantibacter cousiniae]
MSKQVSMQDLLRHVALITAAATTTSLVVVAAVRLAGRPFDAGMLELGLLNIGLIVGAVECGWYAKRRRRSAREPFSPRGKP